ncbi:uncharacterized protein PFLUO_LOCUS4562 [Penicillium psychrofluorescens]|uniref:uncharacterized protein n=1 Tax=Penicillium psychrofluorescens TaxID=3158075 RepID=UPI003CCCCBE2
MTRRRPSDPVNATVVASKRLVSQPNSNTSSPGSLGNGRIYTPLEQHSSTLPGYLGSTSFTAVLAEHRNEIPFDPDESSDSVSADTLVEPDRLQSGLEILHFLYNLTVCQTLVQRYYAKGGNAAMPKIVVDAILRSIRQIFDGFDANNLTSQLQDLAIQMIHNSSRPLITHQSMTVEEYCSSFTGRNFRWEALGSIFALCGQQLVCTPDNDPLIAQTTDDHRTRDRLLEQVTVASAKCLDFCEQASSANELLAFLQYNDAILRTQQYGDSSYGAWRRLGDLVATIYAAGLHQDTDDSDNCPFFLRQWRRGCFAGAFHMDKLIATFVGRPPLMNYRYCTLTAPLDLSDDVLIAGGDTLNQAISELDSAGWDTHGIKNRMSPSRLRYQLAIFREQTLEIALGTHPQRDLIRKSNEISENARAVWEACPDHLRFDQQMPGDERDGSLLVRYMYLDYLYTFFLLQRSLIKHTNTGQEALLDISRQLLSMVIQISSVRNPLVDMDRHFSWIVLSYGLPSASVLLIELLRQSHEPGPHATPLPRAELIRNLSVFVSFLSWVSRPGHGNYHTCKEAEKKLSYILDQLLDPQPVHAGVVDDATSGLHNFLNWSNYNTWDFNSEYMPPADGFAL